MTQQAGQAGYCSHCGLWTWITGPLFACRECYRKFYEQSKGISA